MTDRSTAGSTYRAGVFDPVVHPDLFSEILPRRLLAFAVDAIIVIVASVPAFVAVAVLGIVTFGFGWLLFPFVFAIVGLGYLAITLGGPDSATIGMRMAELEMRTLGGEKMYPLLAVLHGLTFWISVGLLTPLVLVAGLLSNRHRLLHDMLLGTVLMNAEPLRTLEQLQQS